MMRRRVLADHKPLIYDPELVHIRYLALLFFPYRLHKEAREIQGEGTISGSVGISLIFMHPTGDRRLGLDPTPVVFLDAVKCLSVKAMIS